MSKYQAKATTESQHLMGRRDEIRGLVKGEDYIIRFSDATGILPQGRQAEFRAESIPQHPGFLGAEGLARATTEVQTILDSLPWEKSDLE